MLKGSKLYSTLHMKCPRCQEGDIFMYKGTYKLKTMGEMHHYCPKCGLNYRPEPGFYYGAGYVSYALSAGISIAVFTALYPFLKWSHYEIYIGVISLLVLGTAPLLFRWSRVIWLNIFNRYDAHAIEKHETILKKS